AVDLRDQFAPGAVIPGAESVEQARGVAGQTRHLPSSCQRWRRRLPWCDLGWLGQPVKHLADREMSSVVKKIMHVMRRSKEFAAFPPGESIRSPPILDCQGGDRGKAGLLLCAQRSNPLYLMETDHGDMRSPQEETLLRPFRP